MRQHHRAPEPPPIFSTFHYGRDIIDALYETEVRSERQLAGIAAAKAEGVTFGKPAGKWKGLRFKVTPEKEASIKSQIRRKLDLRHRLRY